MKLGDMLYASMMKTVVTRLGEAFAEGRSADEVKDYLIQEYSSLVVKHASSNFTPENLIKYAGYQGPNHPLTTPQARSWLEELSGKLQEL